MKKRNKVWLKIKEVKDKVFAFITSADFMNALILVCMSFAFVYLLFTSLGLMDKTLGIVTAVFYVVLSLWCEFRLVLLTVKEASKSMEVEPYWSEEDNKEFRAFVEKKIAEGLDSDGE